MSFIPNQNISSWQVSVDDSDPVFNAPWEARAFAIVNQLAADKHYSWAEWTDSLSNEITAAEQVTPGSRAYYENWLRACEKLLIAKGLITSEAIHSKVAQLTAEREAEQKH